MPNRTTIIACLLVAAATPAVVAAQGAPALPPVPRSTQSPWNGDWSLSQTRNTAAIRQAAADDYRFTLAADGGIRWEIPSLHEVVIGRTDGQPMTIRRSDKDAGLTLSVTAVEPYVLRYVVSRAGRPVGEGRMTLVDQGTAWVDISQPPGRSDLASAVVYVRPGKQGA